MVIKEIYNPRPGPQSWYMFLFEYVYIYYKAGKAGKERSPICYQALTKGEESTGTIGRKLEKEKQSLKPRKPF